MDKASTGLKITWAKIGAAVGYKVLAEPFSPSAIHIRGFVPNSCARRSLSLGTSTVDS